MNKAATILCIALALGAVIAHAQSLRPQFEVASVKPNTSGDFRSTSTTRGGRFVATNYTLRRLIQFAYSPKGSQLLNDHIVGGPAWIDTDHFDLEGRIENDRAGNVPVMVQSLLEDRFQLKVHRETRELPIYDLVVAKRGKLKLSDDQTTPNPKAPPAPATGDTLARGVFGILPGSSGFTIEGRAVPISILVNLLRSEVGRPVVDKTDLQGLFDIHLPFIPESNPIAARPRVPTPSRPQPATPLDLSGASIFTALQEELGLKLESAKGPVEVLMIDHAERPDAN